MLAPHPIVLFTSGTRLQCKAREERRADAADGPGAAGGDSKAQWFLQSGAYGAAFGALALLTQHLLAPVAMHATLNVGLCARDWQRMRNTPAEELARIFAEGEE